ncbi:MAG: hypothetical protein WCG27_09410, partial [Pseudomonadota bacterium]
MKKKFLLALFFTLLILFGSAALFLYYAKELLIGQINRSANWHINPSLKVSFSLPFLNTIRFKNVKITY